MRNRRAHLLMLLLAVCFVAAGCGVSSDAAPRDIPAIAVRPRPAASPTDTPTAAAAGQVLPVGPERPRAGVSSPARRRPRRDLDAAAGTDTSGGRAGPPHCDPERHASARRGPQGRRVDDRPVEGLPGRAGLRAAHRGGAARVHCDRHSRRRQRAVRDRRHAQGGAGRRRQPLRAAADTVLVPRLDRSGCLRRRPVALPTTTTTTTTIAPAIRSRPATNASDPRRRPAHFGRLHRFARQPALGTRARRHQRASRRHFGDAVEQGRVDRLQPTASESGTSRSHPLSATI
jgi:hypothetical protein